ncbi:MAG TPA: hypothetical protein DHV16_04455 [Nitrospiraceae bacterium]|nr:MAG: hypothetical protein A2Z82_05600 [Nitrospirae bacterium GWA2_46_11]OGW25901.1 MAG: hypothetical protein A2X55_02930 [Nitrospirae bacterium GWB2_47_37]HAK89036.1 hypothetical protein [Nitrospiraceae bacterium]HCZ11500.1 hypothetical protein [Nitrospiraceae bacterium]
MIRLENITTEDFNDLSFRIQEGSVHKIITNSDYENKRLLNVILGLERPEHGRVFLFDKEVYSLSEEELNRIFVRTGTVLKDGGLISNLKVWENIVLPVWYHSGKKPTDVEEKAVQRLRDAGMDISHLEEMMGELPGPLPVHEKRLLGFVRSALMDPDLMIYDSVFEGLSPEMSERFIKLTEKFHSEKTGRTSVYITPDEQSVKGIKEDGILRL